MAAPGLPRPRREEVRPNAEAALPPPVEDPDENAVVRALRAGDEAAFRSLFDRHESAMLRVARAHVGPVLAQDVVQETWLAVIRGIRVGAWAVGDAAARHAEAITAAERAVALDSASPNFRAGLSFAHARAGNRDQALAIADEVERAGGSLKEIALVHAALGDIDRAFAYLERALERDPGDLNILDIDPSADPLRDDRRYRDLLRRAGVQ